MRLNIIMDILRFSQTDRHGNTRLAFKIAAEHLNIPVSHGIFRDPSQRFYGLSQQLLEVEDLCDSNHPDERSVMTYIASFFHAFSTMGEINLVVLRTVNLTHFFRPGADRITTSREICRAHAISLDFPTRL